VLVALRSNRKSSFPECKLHAFKRKSVCRSAGICEIHAIGPADSGGAFCRPRSVDVLQVSI
jgi:hypothetical protein